MKKIICLGVLSVMCLGLFFGCETARAKEKPTGKFYTLQDAYDQGLLTVDDLQSIAYYYYEDCIAHDHAECESFVPIPKKPLTLDTETQEAIKQEYLSGLLTLDYAQGATLDNITIKNYLGTYGKCIIVGIIDDCALYDYLFETEHYIGGVLFRNFCGNFARVWKLN